MMKFIQNRGFTLVELLMTTLVISILSTVATVAYLDFSSEARISVTTQRMVEIKKAIVGNPEIVQNGQVIDLGFERHIGALPSTLADLISQGAHPTYDPFTKRGWRGPYLNATESYWNLDSWGNSIQYNSVARTLTSCGINESCGDGDDIIINF